MDDEEEFQRLYGRWEPFDPEGARAFLADFPGEWWVVGGWSIEAFTGVRRHHEDLDVCIWWRDLPALVDLCRGRYHVWGAGSGGLRPVNDDWPELHAEASQVWLREHALAPWKLDVLLNEERDGLWVSRRDETWTAALEDVTWIADDGIRYMRPEVTLIHKALADRPKDRVDLDATWPLLPEDARAWLRHELTTRYPDHGWHEVLATASG